MKLAVRAAVGFLILLIGGIALLVLLPGDVVTTKYPSIQAARDDKLFGRGWLPDVLPTSARDIWVSNNLDLNTSEGEFSFDTNEADALKAKLVTHQIPHVPFDDWKGYLEKKRKAGFEIASYSSDASDWVFLCRYQLGKCEYVMWLRKNG
jgi:hypothetical protein